jgi:predicted permease
MRRMSRHERLRRELEAHLDALVTDGVASGLTPDEARRRARLAFGHVPHVMDECDDARRSAWLIDLRRDVLHGVRLCLRAPAFTAVAIATLAVGIGSNTAVFGLVHALLLASLPVDRPDQLVAVTHGITARGRGTGFPDAFVRELGTSTPLIGGVLARGGSERVTLGVDGVGEPAIGELVSGSFFEVLGLRAAAGRLLTSADDVVPGGHPVVVLSHAFWSRRFGGDPRIVGRTLLVSGHPMTVVGVTPRAFDGLDPGQRVDLRAPLAMTAEVRGGTTRSPRRSAAWELQLVARLSDGAAIGQARDALNAAFARHLRQAGLSEPANIVLRPAGTGVGRTRDALGPGLRVLMTLTLMVLGVAAANLAMLMAARTMTRRMEWAVRAALGAGWRRLARQLFAESLVLAAGGAALGIVVAYAGAAWLARLASGGGSSWLIVVRPAPLVIGVHVAASLAAGVLIGMGPVLRLRRQNQAPEAGQAARGVVAGGRHWLIGAQVALAMVVLVGAALFVRSLQALYATDLGLRPDHLLLTALDPKAAGRPGADVAPFYRDLRERLLAVPSITGVTYATVRALGSSTWVQSVAVEGRAADAAATAARNAVGPDYFRVLGIGVASGRDFAAVDDAYAAKVAVVNESFVRAYLGGRPPLGVRIGVDRPEYRIVGVVRDARLIHVREPAAPTWYIPYEQRSGLKHLDLVVRTNGDPAGAVADVRAAVAAVDPRVALFETRSQQAQIDDLLVTERILAQLVTVCAAIATALASLGLYGLLTFVVSQRRREIGLRMALGGDRAAVVRAVALDVGRAAVAGLLIGSTGAILLARQIDALLYGLAPIDAVSVAGAAGVMAAAVVAGAAWPLRRALRIDPAIALRE